MDIPFLLVVLLALPVVAAAVIVVVSISRRRGRTATDTAGPEPVHRMQADSAAVQDAVVHPPAGPARVESARERRGGTAGTRDQR